MFRQQHVISVFAQWLESTPLLVDNEKGGYFSFGVLF
jgi:hypothetical protein